MQFSMLLAFAAAAVAAPAVSTLEDRQVPLCASGTPQCCATDVLNLVILDCAAPTTVPTDSTAFINTCSEQGQQAKCCLIPILGQALLCSDVVPNAPAPDPAASAAAAQVESS